MYGECDLPYMVESLAKIMKQYSSDLRVWIIEPEKDDEDYEDVEYFMEKIAHAFNQAENHHWNDTEISIMFILCIIWVALINLC